MGRYSFAEYCIDKESKQLVEYCIHNRVSLQPYVDLIEMVCERGDLSNEAKIEEIFQTLSNWAGSARDGISNAAKWAGKGISNVTGSVTRGLGAAVGGMTSALQKGAQNFGTGFNQGWQATQGQQNAGAGGGMPAAGGGNAAAHAAGANQNPAAAKGGASDPAAVQGQMAKIKQMMDGISASTQQVTQLVSQLSQTTGQK